VVEIDKIARMLRKMEKKVDALAAKAGAKADGQGDDSESEKTEGQ
jgi:hypothetical protein